MLILTAIQTTMPWSKRYTGTEYKWFQSYLTGSSQCVHHGAISSEYIGVPQRSILVPVLFTLYINDLPNDIKHSKIVLYADNTVDPFVFNRIAEKKNVQETKLIHEGLFPFHKELTGIHQKWETKKVIHKGMKIWQSFQWQNSRI